MVNSDEVFLSTALGSAGVSVATELPLSHSTLEKKRKKFRRKKKPPTASHVVCFGHQT